VFLTGANVGGVLEDGETDLFGTGESDG